MITFFISFCILLLFNLKCLKKFLDNNVTVRLSDIFIYLYYLTTQMAVNILKNTYQLT